MKKIILILTILGIIGYVGFRLMTRSVIISEDNTINTISQNELSGEKYTLIPDQSQATFELGEDLRGERVQVIGTTQVLSGDVSLENNALQIGNFTIDARTFKTDSEQRDGAIARMILKSVETGNEFITFHPTIISGLSQELSIGQEYQYQITGDLTIKGITQSVVFEATTTLVDEQTIIGSANVVITYADFDISVPNFPFLANVDEQVTLAIQFTAQK